MHRERGRSGKPGTPSFRRGCHHETRPKSLCARLEAPAFHRVDAETPCRDVRAERAQTGGSGCARECPPMPRGGRCQGGGKARAEGAAGESSGRSCVTWAHDWVTDPTLGAVFQTLPTANFLVTGAALTDPTENSTPVTVASLPIARTLFLLASSISALLGAPRTVGTTSRAALAVTARTR